MEEESYVFPCPVNCGLTGGCNQCRPSHFSVTIYPTKEKLSPKLSNEKEVSDYLDSLLIEAYRVYWLPSCEPEETVGYYMSIERAKNAKEHFIKEKNLSKTGLCCGNSKNVYIEKILISN